MVLVTRDRFCIRMYVYLDVVDDALADSDNLPDLGLVKHQEQCGHSLENAWGRVREDRE